MTLPKEKSPMDRTFAFNNRALRVLLILAGVTLDHFQAFDQHTLFLRRDFQDFAALAFILAGDDQDLITSFDMHIQTPNPF